MTKEEINQKLIDTYGLTLDGLPKFRVVWSAEETETRIGDIEEWYGGIFVRKYRGPAICPKYAYLPGRWVLEVLVPTNNEELTTKQSYEPLYVFQNKNGEYLPLNWEVCRIIINVVLNREKPKPINDIEAEDEAMRKEAAFFKEYLDAALPNDFQWKLRNQELILNPYGGSQ